MQTLALLIAISILTIGGAWGKDWTYENDP
jgi:hypothetical protein